MATPRVSDTPATQRGYVAQLALSAVVVRATGELWSATKPMSSRRALTAFVAASQALVSQYGATSRSLAADQYRSTRVTAGIQSQVRLPSIAPEETTAKVAAEADWLAKWQREADEFAAEFEAKLLADAQAAFEKAVADEGRQFTIEAVNGDDRALGFRRVARPDACAWCLSLAIRRTSRTGLAKDFKRYGAPGAMGGDEHFGVYKSRESAGQLPPGATGEVNRYHPNCHCTVEPIFDTGMQTVPDWLHDMADLYDSAPENGSGALNDFRRALNAQRRGETPPDPAPVLPAALPAAQQAQVNQIADLLSRLAA